MVLFLCVVGYQMMVLLNFNIFYSSGKSLQKKFDQFTNSNLYKDKLFAVAVRYF